VSSPTHKNNVERELMEVVIDRTLIEEGSGMSWERGLVHKEERG